jgi:hypothetical protein
VVDRYGEPLGNATVATVTTAAAVGVAARPLTTTTAEDGRFALAATASGSFTLVVQASDHAPFLSTHSLDATSGSLDVGDIQLLGGGGITGRILDQAGNGLPGASATLRPSSGAMRRSMEQAGLLAPAATTAAGVYRFQHVMPWRYRVTASAPGMQAARAANTVEVKEGVETKVAPIRLEVGFELAGVVVGPDDAPVAGAEVRVRNNRSRPRFNGRVTTQNDGRFQMGQLPPGPLQVEVTARGFLGFSRVDVDPTRGQELEVRLQGGIRVTGIVLDTQSGAPVERFAAAIRRIGRLDPGNLGSMVQQLRRKIAALRQPPGGTETPAERAQRLAIVATFEARLARVEREGRTRPAAVSPDVGPVTARPGGKFAFDGVDEGVYAVDIASPDHQFARVAPVEVRRGAPGPDLRVGLTKGYALRGTVVSKHDGTPITGATVALMSIVTASHPKRVRDRRRSLYPWAFARSGPHGVAIMSARADERGRFEFRQAPPGRYFLAVRHPQMADYESELFYVHKTDQKLRAEVGSRADLSGRIHGIPPGRAGNVEVLLLGGHGTMRTVKARADGTYRFGALQPGGYIVRAFAADSRRYVSRQLATIFAPNAVTADPKKTVQHDVTLAAGEIRTLDLSLDLPPAGIVSGTVTINGRPAKRGRAILRPQPGAAPGSGGLSLRATLDELGRFTIRDVPAGKYTLRLYGATRNELHSEPITVAPDQTVMVERDLVSGGLGGRVTTPDGAPAEQIRGNVMVFPGATTVPADLREYRRTKRVHRVRVRNGVFRDDGLTPGPALLLVEIRGRLPVTTEVEIPSGTTLELELTAGRSQ